MQLRSLISIIYCFQDRGRTKILQLDMQPVLGKARLCGFDPLHTSQWRSTVTQRPLVVFGDGLFYMKNTRK